MTTDTNLAWIAKGHTGCTFATLFAKRPQSIGWVRVLNPDGFSVPSDAFVLSLVFEGKDKEYVRQWALANGFYEEEVAPGLTGLRLRVGASVSWVQYFGPDSHVATRRSPQPELLMCVKLPLVSYFKVGFKGLLHLAHASIQHLKDGAADRLWDASYKQTAKRLSHSPTIREAAKTTFCNE